MTGPAGAAPGPVRRTRGPLLFGAAILVFAVGGFGYWATTAPISGATIATGTVSPENSRRSIQHFDGGVVEEIFVREGDRVKKGQVLIRLDDTAARASVDTQEILIRTLEAQLERLRAEYAMFVSRDLSGDLSFSDDLLDRATADPETAEMLRLEASRFESAKAAMISSVDLQKQSIQSYRTQIAGLKQQLVKVVEQKTLLEEDVEVMQSLGVRGLEIRNSISETRLDLSQTELQESERRSEIDSLRESIRLAQLQLESIWTSAVDETVDSISDISTELLNARTTYQAYHDVLDRTVIRAPVDGTLIGMTVNTVGAVVGQGETIVEIVPADERLALQAHIDPKDIDTVEVGQSAQVSLLAYPQRNLPRIHGHVTAVSADSIVDSSTGETYYLATVMVDDQEIFRQSNGIVLLPGMPVQVMIEVSSRTFVDYMLEPILRYRERALRET